jgi:hypothetical protein
VICAVDAMFDMNHMKWEDSSLGKSIYCKSHDNIYSLVTIGNLGQSWQQSPSIVSIRVHVGLCIPAEENKRNHGVTNSE